MNKLHNYGTRLSMIKLFLTQYENMNKEQSETAYVHQGEYGLDLSPYPDSRSRLPPKFNEDFLITDTSVIKCLENLLTLSGDTSQIVEKCPTLQC